MPSLFFLLLFLTAVCIIISVFILLTLNKIPKVVVEIKLGSGEGPREDIGFGHGLQTPFTLKDQHNNM